MELSEKDIQLIEDAILGRLSDKDELLFHERLNDVQFSEELERHRAMVELLTQEGRSAFKEGLQKLDQELPTMQDSKPRMIPMYVRLLVAASVVALICYIGFQWANSSDHLGIYTEYYESYPNLIDPVTKGNESGTMSPFQLYESGRYEAAQSALAALEDSEEGDFYHALTFLHTDDIETAIIKLSEITNRASHRFQIEAKWYLALAHIRGNKKDKASAILKDLQEDEDNPFQDRASQVLMDLE